jgi:hypothetical protein
VSGHVLHEHKYGLHLRDDPGDVRPEVARIGGAELLPGDAERLARVSRRDEIHDSTPASTVEGGKVRPDRRLIQNAVLHSRDQERGCGSFPLHVAHGSVVGSEGQGEPELEAADPGT